MQRFTEMMRLLTKNLFLLFAATFWLLLAGHSAQLAADASQPSGRLSGYVVDETGAVIPGTVILIKRKRYEQKVVANEDGFYSVELPSGSHRIYIENKGYRPFRRKLYIPAYRAITQDFVLVVKGKHIRVID